MLICDDCGTLTVYLTYSPFYKATLCNNCFAKRDNDRE